jgi:hypothetical protein
MRKSDFALRLQPALLDEVRKPTAAEGVALNQLINVAAPRSCRCCVRLTISLSVPGGQIFRVRWPYWRGLALERSR